MKITRTTILTTAAALGLVLAPSVAMAACTPQAANDSKPTTAATSTTSPPTSAPAPVITRNPRPVKTPPTVITTSPSACN